VAIAKGVRGPGAGGTDIDPLFQLPPTEFTAARNALAAKLKKAGKAQDAERVKALPKPPLSAWAVNQVFWRHRKAFDRLMAAGERFKSTQAAQLAGKSGDIRAPLEARREALSEASRLAAALLESGGFDASPDTMRRVNTTLEALATYSVHPDAPQAGRLTDDVDPPGFEALAALIPRGGGKRDGEVPKVIPFRQARPKASKKKLNPEDEKRRREGERRAQVAAARAAVQDAERTLRDARAAAQKAEAELKAAAGRAKQAERERAEIEARYEKLNAKAEDARQDARRVASAAEDAAQAVDDAELALQKAKRALDTLSSST
jgi:hypothetical protein